MWLWGGPSHLGDVPFGGCVRIGVGSVRGGLATARGRITDLQPHSPGGQIGLRRETPPVLPLADETVDVVIASEILEHIPNYPPYWRRPCGC